MEVTQEQIELMMISELADEILHNALHIRPTYDGKWPEVPRNKLLTVSLGNATEWRIGLFDTRPGRCLVAIERKGAFEFPTAHFLHATYIEEKLNLLNGDAMNIADFLNTQFKNEEGMSRKQGYYHSAYSKLPIDEE